MEPSQLWMRLTLPPGISIPDLPRGYRLRTFEAGDEQDWIALLNTGFEPWNNVRLQRILTRLEPRLPRDGIFFITHRTRLAGSACMFLHANDGEATGELGWVVVDPAHRGHGLGEIACLAALDYARRRQIRSVFLRTEESRIAAIRIYLRLGFVPEMRDGTHPERWNALLPGLQS